MLSAFLLSSIAVATPELIDRAQGTYVLSDSIENLERQRQKALEETLASMNFIVRQLAGSKLADKPPLCLSYSFRTEQNTVELQCDAKPSVPLRLDGSPTVYRASGDRDVTVTARANGPDLAYSLDGGEGGLEVRMHFTDDVLRVVKEVKSPHLPVPLKVEYRYKAAE